MFSKLPIHLTKRSISPGWRTYIFLTKCFVRYGRKVLYKCSPFTNMKYVFSVICLYRFLFKSQHSLVIKVLSLQIYWKLLAVNMGNAQYYVRQNDTSMISLINIFYFSDFLSASVQVTVRQGLSLQQHHRSMPLSFLTKN